MRDNRALAELAVRPLETIPSGLEIRLPGIKGVIVNGGMAERFKAVVLKTTEDSKSSVGSNPTPSANTPRASSAGSHIGHRLKDRITRIMGH